MEYSKEPLAAFSRTDLENKKVNELKDILKNLNLRTIGNKEKLIERILQHKPDKEEKIEKEGKITEENKNNKFLLLFLNLLSVSRNKVTITGRSGQLRAFPPKSIADNIIKYYDRINIVNCDIEKINQ